MPEKYNEILKTLYNKEIRVYLPIQELNLLLEPLHKPGEELVEEKEEEEYLIKSESATKSSTEENSESSGEEENSDNNFF